MTIDNNVNYTQHTVLEAISPFHFSYERAIAGDFGEIKTIRQRLDILAQHLFRAKEGHRIAIRSLNEWQWEAKAGFNWRQWLPGFVHAILCKEYKRENRQTIEWFYETFGESRVKQISNRWNLRLEKKHSQGMALTKRDIQALLIGMVDVRYTDMRDALLDIQAGETSRFHIEGNGLRDYFKDKTFEQLTRADCDILYDLLTPFNKIETAFLNRIPEAIPDYRDRGYTLEGWKGVVYLNFEMRRNPQTKRWQNHYILSKLVLDYFTREGVVFPLRDGYRYLYKRIEGGGCYAMLLKSMNKVEGKRNLIVCLPTQVFCYTPDWWESFIDDLRTRIGSIGVKEVFHDIQAHLNKTHYGYVDSSDEKIDLLGFSLGAAQAGRMAALLYDRVHRYEGICPPGLEEEVVDWYARRSESAPDLSKKVSYIFEGPSFDGAWSWDHVPLVGHGKLGFQAKNHQIKTRILRPGRALEEEKQIPSQPIAPQSFVKTVLQFIPTMFSSHIRNTLAGDYLEIYMSHSDDERPHEGMHRDFLSTERYGFERQRQRFSFFLGENDEFFSFLQEKTGFA